MSTLAVFLVLGGATAFAALSKNSVGSKQLKNNAVTTAKIKNNAVTTAKIKNNAVTTAKIQNGAVTGEKVNLGTLGTVPSAANANTVGGQTVTKVFVKIPKSTTVTVGTFGPFKIVATCNAGGSFENFELDPQATDTDIAAFGDGNGAGPIFEREQGVEPNSIDLTGGNVRGITTFSAAQSGGAVATGTLAYDDANTFNGEPVCAIYGQVIS